ncbi:SCP2 sterol-binding domain-containing protein [Nocardiopsis alborubida]|uniref:SCP2 sterol-binding domain-containing protein n=1 Tax=Nocardiopsis alborubida TaxID=146802 RepID=A0A7X6RP47_9ACTN|nr:SCP2 sterol-binding domain-containing protein [Nocardiopsis alborubida]NKY97208.1 SCP2 sterol-binding domain-containing protein [Nocardiopsis alborubida]
MSTTSEQSFQEIRKAVHGRSDDEVLAWVDQREGGADALLNLVFEELPGALIADRAGESVISFQFVIETSGGTRNYFALIEDGKCHCAHGETSGPTVSMRMDVVVFLRVLTGSLAPVRAFLSRRIKVTGDMMTATKFESWFARP